MNPAVALQSSQMPVAPERRVWMAGIPVDVLGEAELIALVERTVSRDERIVLAHVNLHGLYVALISPVMIDLLSAPDSVVHIDGTPILWLAKLLGSAAPEKARNGHIDLLPKLLKRCAAESWSVVIVGSDPDGARDNERALSDLVPGLNIKAYDGYFDFDDRSPGSKQAEIIEGIRAAKPALLLVGMGMPRQEKWIAAIRDHVDVPVIMPVGGFADYFAGRTRTPPRFLGPLGLEWLFRLVHDPRRLGFRYLVEPFLLLGRLGLATIRGARWGRHLHPKAKG